MGAEMLNLEEWMDIKSLHAQGYLIRKISEVTGYSRNTVRRKLRERTLQAFSLGPRATKLDEYKDYIQRRFNECGLSGIRLVRRQLFLRLRNFNCRPSN
jgi:transposase